MYTRTTQAEQCVFRIWPIVQMNYSSRAMCFPIPNMADCPLGLLKPSSMYSEYSRFQYKIIQANQQVF